MKTRSAFSFRVIARFPVAVLALLAASSLASAQTILPTVQDRSIEAFAGSGCLPFQPCTDSQSEFVETDNFNTFDDEVLTAVDDGATFGTAAQRSAFFSNMIVVKGEATAGSLSEGGASNALCRFSVTFDLTAESDFLLIGFVRSELVGGGINGTALSLSGSNPVFSTGSSSNQYLPFDVRGVLPKGQYTLSASALTVPTAGSLTEQSFSVALLVQPRTAMSPRLR